MDRTIAMILLVLSPIALTGAIGAAVRFVRNWRRSWGSHNALPKAAGVLIAGFVIVHLGYYLSPVLMWSNHVTLALWLVCPIAMLACAGLIWFQIRIPVPPASNHGKLALMRWSLVGGLLVTYLLPVVVLGMCR